jgi:thioredoxin 1
MTVIKIDDVLLLRDHINSPDNIIVKYSAEWCRPCKKIHPIYLNSSNNQKYSHVIFLNVDTDNLQEIFNEYNIEGLPTFILYKNGIESSRFSGANESKLFDMLNSTL